MRIKLKIVRSSMKKPTMNHFEMNEWKANDDEIGAEAIKSHYCTALLAFARKSHCFTSNRHAQKQRDRRKQTNKCTNKQNNTHKHMKTKIFFRLFKHFPYINCKANQLFLFEFLAELLVHRVLLSSHRLSTLQRIERKAIRRKRKPKISHKSAFLTILLEKFASMLNSVDAILFRSFCAPICS
jgi:hypothetical protein